MKKSAQVFFSFLIAIIITSCSSVPKGQKPAWADSVNQVFPPEKYITALGYADTQEMAMNVADANLASYFSKEISSFTTARQSFSNTLGTKENLSREITIKSQIELFGIKHTECYFDLNRGLYSVCAYIDRDEAWKIQSQKLNVSQTSFEGAYSNAKNETEALKKIIMLNRAFDAINNFEDMYYTTLVINPSRCTPYTKTAEKKAALENELTRLKLNTKIYIEVTGDAATQTKAVIEDILSKDGFTTTRTKSSDAYILLAQVSLDQNKTNQIFYAYPQIELAITRAGNTVCSFNGKAEKVSAYNSETLSRMAQAQIEQILNERFLSECLR